MLNIKFILNDGFLTSYIINCYQGSWFIEYAKDKYKKYIVDFQNLAFAESKDTCLTITGRFPLHNFGIQNGITDYTEMGELLDSFISKLLKSKEFNVLKKQTTKSIELLEIEWNRNLEITNTYVKNLGIDIEGEFNIYIVHPGLRAGSYLGNNTIIWSFQEYWSNYNTVYLWHEILHSYFEHCDINHALIELITDEELRTKLNGGEYPPFVGHQNLVEIKNKILPIWREYLNNNSTDIKSLIKNINK